LTDYIFICEWDEHQRRSEYDHTDRHLFEHILEREHRIMATLDQITADLATLQSDSDATAARVQASLDALSAQVTDLQAQIDALSTGAVTQDQIDALDASVKAIDAGINAIDPAVTPAP
jgi:prefoldin subunit 5